MSKTKTSLWLASMQVSQKNKRFAVMVCGTVQGVGFRPFVHSLATSHQLTGFVRNNNGAVEIEVQGDERSLSRFLEELELQAPPLSDIRQVETDELVIIPENGFSIKDSVEGQSMPLMVSPDTGTCKDCLAELFDKSDRRYRYPFINCTNCGPRFTIIEALPYDRKRTTMRRFVMCKECQNEYANPTSRRFHAQPNACAKCGPMLIFKDTSRSIVGAGALETALSELKLGRILAIKGLGGFHLVCDANNSTSIRRLRERKTRRFKPLALMMRDVEMVSQYCEVSKFEESALSSFDQPIVILKRKAQSTIPLEVAPDSDLLGVMLAYTPLHHLLLHEFGSPLVATSGNKRDEPIAIDNEEARLVLCDLADAWLENDRDIHFRFDDSIVQLVDDEKMVLRRARGIAPHPIAISYKTPQTILGVGGNLKNTFCVLTDGLAYLSQHIGDLESIESETHFENTLLKFQKLFKLEPEIIACDLHPDYRSTAIANSIARRMKVPLIGVQHHHAHAVACMLEHGLQGNVLAVIFDGIGLGTDGTLWGGEFLVANPRDYQRLAHFTPVAMPGGASAVKNSWRMALGYACDSTGSLRSDKFRHFIQRLEASYGTSVIRTLEKQVGAGINTPYTSSCGRLFDACAALLGICDQNEYEGQCAIELEMLARRYIEKSGLGFEQLGYYPTLIGCDFPIKIDPIEILCGVLDDVQAGASTEAISAKFHSTISRVVWQVCTSLRNQLQIEDVCLSGGVFQNRVLLSLTKSHLRQHEFRVFYPNKVPANDGGLSLGQAIIAAANAGKHPSPKHEVS